MIYHTIACHNKLQWYAISGHWITSFLNNQSQKVTAKGTLFAFYLCIYINVYTPVISGAPLFQFGYFLTYPTPYHIVFTKLHTVLSWILWMSSENFKQLIYIFTIPD